MRFQCGPTLEERAEMRRKRDRAGRLWFAWYPVRLVKKNSIYTELTGECAWLERVWRARYNSSCRWRYGLAREDVEYKD